MSEKVGLVGRESMGSEVEGEGEGKREKRQSRREFEAKGRTIEASLKASKARPFKLSNLHSHPSI